MEINKIVIEKYEKLNDRNVIGIIKTLSLIYGLVEVNIDTDIKKVIVKFRDNFITKEMVLKILDKNFENKSPYFSIA